MLSYRHLSLILSSLLIYWHVMNMFVASFLKVNYWISYSGGLEASVIVYGFSWWQIVGFRYLKQFLRGQMSVAFHFFFPPKRCYFFFLKLCVNCWNDVPSPWNIFLCISYKNHILLHVHSIIIYIRKLTLIHLYCWILRLHSSFAGRLKGSLFIFIFFLQLYLWHMEVSRPRVESDLKLRSTPPQCNMGSKPHLWPMLQLVAMPNP